MQARRGRTTRSPRRSRLYHPSERSKGRTTLARSSTFCPIWLPFMDDFRTEFAVSSEKMSGMLSTMQTVISGESGADV